MLNWVLISRVCIQDPIGYSSTAPFRHAVTTRHPSHMLHWPKHPLLDKCRNNVHTHLCILNRESSLECCVHPY